MGTIAVNPPKTPVTKGSSGIANATVPNVCKMPGPPAPFVPTPLPNIGKSGSSPKDYSKKVTFDGEKVAIRGASFKSQGDMASKGTGGGLISSNTHGPTKFIGPGSMNVQVEGKSVHHLGEPMLNNCGPSGSPPNAATLAGVIQAPQPDLGDGVTEEEAEIICDAFCECQAAYDFGQISGSGCCSRCFDSKIRQNGTPNMSTEQSYWMPKNPNQAPELLTPGKFNQMAQGLSNSRLYNFVSGLVSRPGGVPVSAGGSVSAASGLRMSRAVRRLPPGHSMKGHVCRPDLTIRGADGSTRVLDAKFEWKKGQDKFSNQQAKDYPRIDADGDLREINREECGC